MFIRSDLKSKAKATLRLSYWKAFLVAAIISIFCTNSGSNSRGSSNNADFGDMSSVTDTDFMSFLPGSKLFYYFAGAAIMLIFVIIIIGIAYKFLLANPLLVGGRKYFLDSTRHEFDLSNLAYAFKSRDYWNIVKVMFMRDLFIFLWTLLFIIPGIYKWYQYRLVPYILAEDPTLDYNSALRRSKNMTDGLKFDIFVLDLSFIGWYILASFVSFTCLILIGSLNPIIASLVSGFFILFIAPYVEATFGELYIFLKNGTKPTNLNNGLIDNEPYNDGSN